MPTTLVDLEGLPARVAALERGMAAIHVGTLPAPVPAVQQVVPPAPQPVPGAAPVAGPITVGGTLTWTPASWAAYGGHAVPFAKTDPVTFALSDGTYKNSVAFGGSWAPPAHGASDAFTKFTLTSATRSWPPQVVFDSTDHAWGKAAILGFGKVDPTTHLPVGDPTICLVRNIAVHGITRSTSDGTAGLYGDINSDMRVEWCEFSGNNDGVFANSSCCSVHVQDSSFGVGAPNEASDGKSHNIYSNAAITTMLRCIGFGGSNNNNFKFRGVGPVVVDQCWLESESGRHADRPDGGSILISNSVLVQRVGSPSQNMFAMAEEHQINITTDPLTSVMRYRNCEIWVTGPCAFMVGSMPAAGVVDVGGPASIVFEPSCRWHFVKSTDPTRPTHLAVEAKNGGTVIGLPFPIPPADASGTSLITIPESSFEAGPPPACPTSPVDLPAALLKHLPGTLV